MNKLKFKVMLLIFSVIIISFGMFFYIFYKFQYDRLYGIQEQNYEKVFNSFEKNQQLHLKDNYLQEAQKFLTPEVIDAFVLRDRESLLNLTKELYTNLKLSDEYLEVVHFHLSDGRSLLRLHMLNEWGDDIAKQRVMVSDIHRKKIMLSGFEYGYQGMSYRILIPIFKDGVYYGAFEIGASPKKVLDYVTYFNNLQGIIRLYEGDKKFQFTKLQDENLLSIIPKEKTLPSNTLNLNIGDKYLSMYSFEVSSYDGKTMGDFIFFSDLTKYHVDFNIAINKMFGIFLVSVVILYLLFHYIFNIYSKQIHNLFDKTRAILDNQKNIIILTNSKELIDANRGFFEFVGFNSIEEFKKYHKCICDLFESQEGYLTPQMGDLTWAEYILKNSNQTHLAKILKGDEEYIFKVYAKQISKNQKNQEFVVTFEDITQELKFQKQLKEKDILLQQQSRLAALGEMMGNIAHQWRQPLSAITSSASGLEVKREFGILEDNDIPQSVDFIVKNANFLSQTIENFRNFFNKNNDKTNFNVAHTISNTSSIISHTYKNFDIELILDLDESLVAYGVENLFSQVVLNLLSNAKDAIVQNNIENKKVKITLKKSDDLIHLEFIDNGGGVPKGLQEKIFDPYFTTKHQSQGTGLGLYMSLEIIKNHFDGIMKVSNKTTNIGTGACFDIYFKFQDHTND